MGKIDHGMYKYFYLPPPPPQPKWVQCMNSGVYPKWNGNSANSWNLINHWSMNLGQFKDPACYLWLTDAVVASWSLTQEVAGLNPFTVMTNILSLNSANSKKTFRENSINHDCHPVEWTAVRDSDALLQQQLARYNIGEIH